MSEKITWPEQINPARAELLELEKTGKYVFHGTVGDFKILEPRQPTNDNVQTGAREKHGQAAVCATPFVDTAIFAALIKNNAGNVQDESDCGWNSENNNFYATQNLLEAAKKIKAKVYVLDKNKFNIFEGEFRSDKEVNPVVIVEVTYEDLPKNIKVIE